jgi:serine/threonine protein kinase
MHTDLYATLKKQHFKGFEPKAIRHFAKQLVTSLRVLRRTRIIHCDLKPENILLRREGSTELKVIDFGSSCFDTEKAHTYIQSRFYRSPEIILGGEYGTPIDMWSLGCILAELHSGRPLFPGNDEKEQLLYQMELLGAPPAELLDNGCSRAKTYFQPGTNIPLTSIDRKGRTRLPGSRALSRGVGSTDPLFLDFVARCLEWDPAARMTPREAAHHQFLTGMCDGDGGDDSGRSSGGASATPPVTSPSSAATVARSSASTSTNTGTNASGTSTDSASDPATHSGKPLRRRDSRQPPGIVALPTAIRAMRSRTNVGSSAQPVPAGASPGVGQVPVSVSVSGTGPGQAQVQRAQSEGVVPAQRRGGGGGSTRQRRIVSDSHMLGSGGDGGLAGFGGGFGADRAARTSTRTHTRTRTSASTDGGPVASRSRRASQLMVSTPPAPAQPHSHPRRGGGLEPTSSGGLRAGSGPTSSP